MELPQIQLKPRKNTNNNDYTISFRGKEAESMLLIENYLRQQFPDIPNSKKGVVAFGLNKLITLLTQKTSKK